MFLLALAALPPSVSAQAAEEAQAGEEDSLSFWHDEALKIVLFSSPPLSTLEYTPELEEMERRVKRARIALGMSVVPLVLGTGLAVAGAFGSLSQTMPNADTSGQDATLYAGSAIVGAGAVWMITSGIILGVRKRQRRQLRQAHYRTPRRVQWDLGQSRLVF